MIHNMKSPSILNYGREFNENTGVNQDTQSKGIDWDAFNPISDERLDADDEVVIKVLMKQVRRVNQQMSPSAINSKYSLVQKFPKSENIVIYIDKAESGKYLEMSRLDSNGSDNLLSTHSSQTKLMGTSTNSILSCQSF